jgi:hypothetical protein
MLDQGIFLPQHQGHIKGTVFFMSYAAQHRGLEMKM